MCLDCRPDETTGHPKHGMESFCGSERRRRPDLTHSADRDSVWVLCDSYDEHVLETPVFVAFVPVRDLTVARAFYVGTLGLTFREESPFAVVVDAHGTTLRLTQVPELHPQRFTW